MTVIRHCAQCDATIHDESQFCQECGAKAEEKNEVQKNKKKPKKKSGKTALLLCVFFGFLGVHRFYVGKIGSGILTLITGGLLGLWTIVDLIRLAQNKFTDKHGNYLIVTENTSLKQRLIITLGSLIFWLVITLSLLLSLLHYLITGLTDIAKAQLDALRQGNIAQAYSYTSAQYQDAISLEQFKKWLADYPELVNNKAVTFDVSGINNSVINNQPDYLNSGFLESTVTSNSGEKLHVNYIFIKENGMWKIIGIFPKKS